MSEENENNSIKIMNMPRPLYEGKTVNRFYDRDVEKGDVDYKSWDQRPETTGKIRFYLDAVAVWELFIDPFEIYNIQETKEVITVTLDLGSRSVTYNIIESLEVFDALMDDMNNNRKLDV